MATTLAELAINSQDKLKQGFINELITDSYILNMMTFDDCLSANGTSDLVYGYKRVKTGASAAFRELNEEPKTSEVAIERITTKPGILSSKWEMDRVAKAAAEDLYALKVAESKNAVVRMFNKTLIDGDTETDEKGFDGLAKALKGSSTEFTSAVDLTALDKMTALAFATEMDTLLASLTRDPDVLAVSPHMATVMNAICRYIGMDTITMDEAGKRVQHWDGIRIEKLRDGALATNDVYAVCFGMEEFHGITLAGEAGVTVALPDWSAPGAVKSGDSEFVCGCALKATKAAGVLHPMGAKPEPETPDQG